MESNTETGKVYLENIEEGKPQSVLALLSAIVLANNEYFRNDIGLEVE